MGGGEGERRGGEGDRVRGWKMNASDNKSTDSKMAIPKAPAKKGRD